MILRDAYNYDGASQLLRELVARAGPGDKLFVHAHIQLGAICNWQKRLGEAEAHFRAAVEAAPKSELASLNLFHVLADRNRGNEALAEAVRLLSLRESLGYRELFDEMKLGADVDRSLERRGRELLASHLAAQRARDSILVGDTVRVTAVAPPNARPGSLAMVRKLFDDGTASIRFADGERVEVLLCCWITTTSDGARRKVSRRAACLFDVGRHPASGARGSS